MIAPTERLKAAIRAMTPEQRQTLDGAGFERRLTRRAAQGQSVNACFHLRLFGWFGIDPLTGGPQSHRVIGDLHMPSLSAALRMRRFQDKLTLRSAAKSARMSYSALGRIERGEVVSIQAILAACKFIGRQPFDFVSADVSRETQAETRSAA